MKKPVLLGAFLFSLVLAALNNLINKRAVDWIGSPDVLEKPSGWPSLGFAKGILAGFKVAWKGLQTHSLLILGGIALIAILIFLLNRFRGVPVSSMIRTALRLGLSAMFLAAAYPKFQDPKGFAILVAQYQFLPSFVVDAFALWLAAFEITVGLGLILTAWEKEFSALVGVLLLMFIVALGQALSRDLGIACGCFDIEGATDIGETWFSLVRDIVLLAPVAWLTVGAGKRFLWQPKNG
jgi:hypothetical protein